MNTWIFMMEQIYVWKRNFGSGRSQMLFKIDVLENVASFIGRHLCWCRFLIKMLCSGLQVCNFIKKRLLHRCFPLKFAKFLTTLYRALPVSASGIYACFHTAFSLRGQNPFCYPGKMAGESREWFITTNSIIIDRQSFLEIKFIQLLFVLFCCCCCCCRFLLLLPWSIMILISGGDLFSL